MQNGEPINMVKNKKLKTGIIICSILLAAVLWICFKGVIVFDYSAEQRGDYLYWDGAVYTYSSGAYREGKTIAKTRDKAQVNQVEEDPSHTFVVLRSFLDQSLYVREDYPVPDSGEVTAVCWGGERITDPEFCRMVSDIAVNAYTGDSFEYETDGIYTLTDTQEMKELYFAYEDCPVATEFMGYMGIVDDKWVITTYISDGQYSQSGSPRPYKVMLSIIPGKYMDELTPYFEELR